MAGEDFKWDEDLEEPMTGDDEMPFGKHKGEKLDDVPAEYLLWLWEQEWTKTKWRSLFAYLEDCKEALEQEVGEGRSYHDPTEPFPFCIEDNPF